MSDLQRASSCLRFFGDGLDPNELSDTLLATPTHCWSKDELWSNNGVGQLRPTGGWILDANWRGIEGLDDQIISLFQPLTSDLRVWKRLSRQFAADVFCGLFLLDNSGSSMLSAQTMDLLSQRGLSLNLELYQSEHGRMTSRRAPEQAL